jgi:hypothetical protein
MVRCSTRESLVSFECEYVQAGARQSWSSRDSIYKLSSNEQRRKIFIVGSCHTTNHRCPLLLVGLDEVQGLGISEIIHDHFN